MGLLDRKSKKAEEKPRSALDQAADPHDESAVDKVVQWVLDAGLDGVGPLGSAQETADRALEAAGSPEAAVRRAARRALTGGGVGGFATGIGGFVTMPVAMPVNVLEFYLQAARMVGTIATLRGYDVRDERIRTAVLITLVGSHADDILAKAGLSTAGGRAAQIASRQLPPAALMAVNKAIGFRLLRGLGEKTLTRLGRGIPVAGGVAGAGVDIWMMKRIADQAMKEFPRTGPTEL